MRPDTPSDRGAASLAQQELKDRSPGAGRGHAWLDVARVFQLPPPRAGHAAALALLGDAGWRAFRRHGHAAVASACFPSIDPLRVRFVDPAAAIGLAAAGEADLPARYEAPRPDLPVILGQEPTGPSRTRFRLRVPPDLRALEGHFPDIPVVPGMIQVGWAVSLARSALGVDGALAGIPAIKFRRIVQPGREFSLSLDWDAPRRELLFSLSSDDCTHSAGRLVVGVAHA